MTVIRAAHDGAAHADATIRTGAAAMTVIRAAHDGAAHADATYSIAMLGRPSASSVWRYSEIPQPVRPS
jgi:hypothetical protein